jgi:hypothetical protein
MSAIDIEQDEISIGYQRRIKAYQKKRDQIDQVISKIALFRLLSFLGFLFFAFSGWYDNQSLYLWISLPFLLTYLFLAWQHEKLYILLPRAELMIQLNQECHHRVQQAWHEIKDGGEWAIEEHRFIDKELQVFGAVSLYKAINHCTLFGSKKKLAQALKHGLENTQELKQIQEAVQSLIPEKNLRDRVWVEGKLSGLNQKEIEKFIDWTKQENKVPAWIYVLSRISPLILMATWIQAILSLSFEYITLWQPFLILQIVIYMITTSSLSKEYDLLVAQQHRPIQALELIFKLLEHKKFSHPYLQSWQEKITKSQSMIPSQMIHRLSKTANALAVKHSALLFGILNVLFLWELQYVKKVIDWKKEYAHHIPSLLEAIYEFEFLSSLSFFAQQHPSYTTANLIDMPWQKSIELKINPINVQAIGHPLFQAKTRKTNDYTMQSPFKLLMITGSNMSGKSSFLRALGMNLKLAQMGCVVCAKHFEFIHCDIATSIQVTDDPSQGWSRFYAEVKRIKSIIQRAESENPKPLFYLIDEMLSGTNSHERQIAAKSISKQLLHAQAFGIITTHDLALTQLAETENILIDCGYFSDDFDGIKLNFDYQLKKGIANTTNALRVLSLEGIQI